MTVQGTLSSPIPNPSHKDIEMGEAMRQVNLLIICHVSNEAYYLFIAIETSYARQTYRSSSI